MRPDWDLSPCGLLTMRPDGAVIAANRTLLAWTERSEPPARLTDVLSVGSRIYWETHLAPLLLVEGRIDEVALDLARHRSPVVVTAVTDGDVVHVSLASSRERARFERELVLSRAAAERSSAQVQALQDVTSALSAAQGLDGVATALVTAVVSGLGARAATVWWPDASGALTAHRSAGDDTPVPPEEGLTVPLPGAGSDHGLLVLRPRTDPAADPLDPVLLETVARQGGLALDRAVLFGRNAEVAHALQQSLLYSEPVDDVRVDVASVYLPGVLTLEVGGDWFDAFTVGRDLLAIAVGDVVGSGLMAAAAMGQLRSALRAVTTPGSGPGRVLERLDRFAERSDATVMATVASAQLDLASGVLRYACAGHPPPLLVPADGEPRFLDDGRSTPLAAYLRPEARPEGEVALAPGDRLVLYTDGLVERRDRDLASGLEALRHEAAASRSLGPAAGVSRLARTLLMEGPHDDVCILVLNWTGGEGSAMTVSDSLTSPEAQRGDGDTVTIEGPSDEDGVRIVPLSGEIDSTVTPGMIAQVGNLVAASTGVVVVLAAVTFFDSSGVRLVDRFARECGRVGVRLRIVAPPGSPARAVLDLVGLSERLVLDDVPAALAAVR